MSRMQLFVVRHGITDWNLEERFQGQLDTPLNRRGAEQAIVLRRRLEGVSFDMVYSSPLKRAFETARIIRGTAGSDRQDR